MTAMTMNDRRLSLINFKEDRLTLIEKLESRNWIAIISTLLLKNMSPDLHNFRPLN